MLARQKVEREAGMTGLNDAGFTLTFDDAADRPREIEQSSGGQMIGDDEVGDDREMRRHTRKALV
jgi:hypothetical protein